MTEVTENFSEKKISSNVKEVPQNPVRGIFIHFMILCIIIG